MFRSPVPEPAGPGEPPRIWDSNTILLSSITNDIRLPRASHCSIEVDICAQHILNRNSVKERPLHHDFVERERPISTDLKLVHSMAGLWKDETKRRKKQMAKSKLGDSPFPREALVSMSADPRDSQPPGWINEEEYQEQVRQLVAKEEGEEHGTELDFSNYVKQDPKEPLIPTTLQSVEDLYPENLRQALGLERKLLRNADLTSSIQVDEKGILELEAPGNGDRKLPDGLDEGQKKGSDTYDKPDLAAELGLPLKGVDEGFGVSGLRSGRRPCVPLSRDLLLSAKALGLTSKVDDIQKKTEGVERVNLKRSTSVLGPGSPRKRPKREDSTGTTSRAVVEDRLPSQNVVMAKADQAVSTCTPPQTQTPSSQQQHSVLKGGSQKSQGNQTLNFPVVKDPQEPSTVFRLAQRSASQRSDGGIPGSMGKQVSFNFSVSVDESSPKFGHSGLGEPQSVSESPGTPPPPKLHWAGDTTMFLVSTPPPSASEVISTMQSYGLPDVIYQDAFYSNDDDVPPRPREYAGREYRLGGNSLPYLPDFDPTGTSPATFGADPELAPDFGAMEARYERQRDLCTLRSWEIAEPPPSFAEVSGWWDEKQKKRKVQKGGFGRPPAATQTRKPALLSQIIGPTPQNTHGFKYSLKQKSTSVRFEAQYMSTMSLEVHVNSRGKLVPNPEEDEVQCIFWCLRSDEQSLFGTQEGKDATISGIVVLSAGDGRLAQQIRSQTTGVEVDEENSELDLMVKMVDIVRAHDPDILTGYEVHGGSWGYLVERAMHKYEFDLCSEFSRTKSDSLAKKSKDGDRWGFRTTSMLHVTGRHIINVWRAMRGELNLLQYSMENVVWHLLHRRIPHYTWRTLSDWYLSGRPRDLSKVLRYYLERTRMDIEILEANELIPRTSEQARLLGVDFFSVFSRGSQFKVESIMFRIAKPENFILVSPSRKQVGGQNALECLPLVMEPQSAFYASPLLVLDFQSLYPSVMIAYNYCYSTCLGRVVSWRGTNKLGFTEYKRREGLLSLLKDHINIAPNGMMYSKPEIRKSLLAKMLTEILETRVMVKSGMKEDKDDRTLQKLLHNRQLALKLLANVTYGYTSASFSGRMPCSEIADSIVQTGRETLERTIAYIHSVERWGAEVVYGDTDSLFVYLKGRTRQQAFDIGAEMAKEITNMNPRPVKLKFEKVYHPCVLLAKKRYVGYKYESRDQTVPEFDAKGIETVRRDGTPAEQKIEEKALRLLFETADLSQVKEYFQSQCSKIMQGSVSIQDFVFAKEIKLGTYSAKGPGPPGALISTKRMLEDARAEPQYGERVPYVVVSGAPGARLIDRCVPPETLLNNPHATLDAEYYISKNLIPPLERIFNLVGANVRAWFDEMPKVQQVRRIENAPGAHHNHNHKRNGSSVVGEGGASKTKDTGGNSSKKTLESFLTSTSCLTCGVKMSNPPLPFPHTTTTT
ncbi:hypothetical protein B0J18DRAFT_420267, partial [Chaetomium sp. MPI-SDFR-AT-0129]